MKDKTETYNSYIVSKPIKDIKNVFSGLFGGIATVEIIILGINFLITAAVCFGIWASLKSNTLAFVLVLIGWILAMVIFSCILISTNVATGIKRWKMIVYAFKNIGKENKRISKAVIRETTNIKEIKNGVIYLNNGAVVKLYKLEGVNVDLLSAFASNQAVEIASRGFMYNDMKAKFIIIDEPFDISTHNNYLNSLIDQSQNSKTIDQLNIYRNQNNLIANGDFNKAAYIAIYGKNEQEIRTHVINVLNPMKLANTNVFEVRDNKIIARILNKLLCCDSQPWVDEKGFVIKNFNDITFSKDSNNNSQSVSCILEVRQMPNFLYSGWMRNLANFTNVQAIIDIFPANSNVVVNEFSRAKRRLKANWSYIRNEGEQVNMSEYFQNFSDLIQDIATGNKFPWYMHVSLLLSAKNKKELTELKKTVLKALKNDKYKIDQLFYRQKMAYQNLLSFDNKRCAKDWTISVATNDVLGAAFPFWTNALNDPKGLFLGLDAFSGTPFFIDFKYKDSQKRNSNVFTICGQVGGGKSYCTKHIINWLRNTGCKQFIIAPTDDYFKFAKEYDKVKVINVIDKKHGLINPLQIFDNSKNLQMHINTFLGWLSLICASNFDETDSRIMTEILMDLYSNFGIIDGVSFIDIPNDKWPTGDDLFKFAESKLLQTNDRKDKLIVDRFWLLSEEGVYGNLWNGHTTIDVKDDNMVIFYTKDISSDNPKDKVLMDGTMYLLFNFINSELQKNLIRNNSISDISKYQWISVVIDEAHRLINKNNPIALKALIAMAKEIRHYQGILINVTQSISDFKNGGGEDIIKQSLYHIIFNLSGADIADYEDMLKEVGGLTDKGKEFVSTALQGDALITIGNHYRGFVSVKANEGNSNVWEDKKVGYDQ